MRPTCWLKAVAGPHGIARTWRSCVSAWPGAGCADTARVRRAPRTPIRTVGHPGAPLEVSVGGSNVQFIGNPRPSAPLKERPGYRYPLGMRPRTLRPDRLSD